MSKKRPKIEVSESLHSILLKGLCGMSACAGTSCSDCAYHRDKVYTDEEVWEIVTDVLNL